MSRKSWFAAICSRCVCVRRSLSDSSIESERLRIVFPFCSTSSWSTIGRLRPPDSPLMDKRYLQDVSPSIRSTSMMSLPFRKFRENRLRTLLRPPRLEIALARPPPGAATSPRNRKRSSRLDFPAALGPTMKSLRSRLKSIVLKFCQLLAEMWVIFTEDLLPSSEHCLQGPK